MLHINKLSNGLTLIIEEMPHFESVAYDLAIPGGIVCDSPDSIGASLILAELTTKGAGGLSSTDLSNSFDEYGIRHGEGAGHDRFSYRGQSSSDYLKKSLELVSKMISEPVLPENEIDNIRSLCLLDIEGLKDNPARRAMLSLSESYFPAPHSRPGIGTKEGLEKTDINLLRKIWKEQYASDGAVLSIAGKVKNSEMLDLCERVFSNFKGKAAKIPAFEKFPEHKNIHIHDDSAQLQIILAYPSAKFGDSSYYAAKVANQILSGGMFGRLFIEVREKRGLCYSVYARHSATNEYGLMQAYAGTTPERAHETLEVMLSELKRVKGSVTEDEMSRVKANLKSSLIIGGESPAARASSNSGDWWINKKIRSLDEIINAVNAVSIKDVDNFIEQFPADSYTLLTLGKRDLKKESK